MYDTLSLDPLIKWLTLTYMQYLYTTQSHLPPSPHVTHYLYLSQAFSSPLPDSHLSPSWYSRSPTLLSASPHHSASLLHDHFSRLHQLSCSWLKRHDLPHRQVSLTEELVSSARCRV
ncbi:hypothetical protein Scep_030328 [Stephania cephalantha]|uniref:Uncharacterized protein n=1 Tax=Stephania cephalantha TaxID=152367 RepID=A0AAP0E2Y4_9MAGN